MSNEIVSSNISLTLLTRQITFDNKGKIIRDTTINYVTGKIYDTPKAKKKEDKRFVFR